MGSVGGETQGGRVRRCPRGIGLGQEEHLFLRISKTKGCQRCRKVLSRGKRRTAGSKTSGR